MSEKPNTVMRYEHVVRRCTDPTQASKELNDAYGSGYRLLDSGTGGQDGQVIWLIFQKATEVIAEQRLVPPEQGAPQPPAPPVGGTFQ